MLIQKISCYFLIIMMVASMNTIISCTRQEKQEGLKTNAIKCMSINVWSGLDYDY